MPSLNLEGHEAASSVLWMTHISLVLMTLLITRIEQRGFFKIMNVSFYLFFFFILAVMEEGRSYGISLCCNKEGQDFVILK